MNRVAFIRMPAGSGVTEDSYFNGHTVLHERMIQYRG